MADSDVFNFSPNPQMSEYSLGRNYGNPGINNAMFGLFGFNQTPKPQGKQDIYDSFVQRERSRHFFNIQGRAFANNALFRHAGFSAENNLLQFAGKAFGSPDGAVAKMLSPLVGGNPMAAQMQLYAGLNGAATMGAFGKYGAVSETDTNKMMDTLDKSFYNTQKMEDTKDPVTGNTIQGVRTDYTNRIKGQLINNPEYARQLGIGVPTGPDAEQESSRLKNAGMDRQLAVDNLTKKNNQLGDMQNAGKIRRAQLTGNIGDKLKDQSDAVVSEIKKLSSSFDTNEAKRGTKDYDEKISKALKDQLDAKLKAHLKVTESELKASSGEKEYSSRLSTELSREATRALGSAGLTSEEMKRAKNDKGEYDQSIVNQILSTKSATPQVENASAKLDSLFKEMKENSSNKKVTDEERGAKVSEIKDILKSLPGMTEEKISKGMDNNGKFKPGFIEEVTSKEQQRANLEKAGVNPDIVNSLNIDELSTKAKTQHLNNLNRVDDLATAQAKIAENSGTSEAQVARRKEGQADLTKTLIKLGATEEDIKKNSSGGKIDQEYITRIAQGATTKSRLDKTLAEYDNYKKGGGKITGVNFENSRGFAQEDFTSAFTASANLRLLGSKGNEKAKFKGFTENAGGALDAARGIFGDDLSGGQLTSKISGLLGSKAGDLSTKQGSAEVEKMLRDAKATARVAGVSIDAMIGVIDAAKEVASNNPKLKYMSAASTTDMTIKAFKATAAQAVNMSSEDFRRAGGTQGLVSSRIAEEQSFLGSDIGQSVVGLQQMFEGDEKNKKIVADVLKEQGKTGGINEQNINKVYEEVAKRTGMGVDTVAYQANNAATQAAGMQNADIVNNATGLVSAGAVQTFYDIAGLGDEGTSKESIQKSYAEFVKNNPNKSTKDFITGANFGPSGKDFLSQGAQDFGLMEAGNHLQEDLDRSLNPELYAEMDANISKQAELDTELGKKLGSRNAPIVTQALSTLGKGGELDEKGIKALLGVFTDKSVYTDQAEADRLQGGFSTAIEGAAVGNAATVAEGLNAAKGLSGGDQVSEEDINNIYKQTKNAGSYEDFQNQIRADKEAEKNGKGTEESRARIAAAEKMEKLGFNKAGYDKLKNAKTAAGGVAAGAIASETQSKNDQIIDDATTKAAESLGDDLASMSKYAKTDVERQDIQKLEDYYKNKDTGEVDHKQMMKDSQEGTGAFADTDNGGLMDTEAKKKEQGYQAHKGFDAVRRDIEKYSASIDEAKKKGEESGAGAGEGGNSKDPIQGLIDALNKSPLTDAISALATALKT